MKLLCFQRVLAVAILGVWAQMAPGAEVKTVPVHSAKMGRNIPATLILPDSYKVEPARRFPVLYLLHGAGDTHKKWNNETDIAALADEYGIIVLCPDGGKTSWFFDSPIDPKFQYETFVAKECVEFMDKNYRTIADRRHRALCGNSMGGHGALFLAIRHKDTFGIAVALSGGVDIRPFARKWSIARRIGNIKKHPENWENLTVATSPSRWTAETTTSSSRSTAPCTSNCSPTASNTNTKNTWEPTVGTTGARPSSVRCPSSPSTSSPTRHVRRNRRQAQSFR